MFNPNNYRPMPADPRYYYFQHVPTYKPVLREEFEALKEQLEELANQVRRKESPIEEESVQYLINIKEFKLNLER